jgi:isocitrate dehydrogenase
MKFILNIFLFSSSWCRLLEESCIETVDSQKMTKDLAICIHGLNKYELKTKLKKYFLSSFF